MAHILVGVDGLCLCGYADKCACSPANVGSGMRCSEEKLRQAGHFPIRVQDMRDINAITSYPRKQNVRAKIRLVLADGAEK